VKQSQGFAISLRIAVFSLAVLRFLEKTVTI